MVKKLSKKELFNLIKEAVTKKVNLLREDIDVDDDEVWDYYDDDNSGDDWLSSYGKMPKGYDDDVTDVDTLDRMAQMNNNLPVDRIGSPALKRAEMNASWAASDREDRDNADRLNSQYEDNYYDDSNENSDPDSSAWHSDSYNKNLKFGLKDWNKNTPNEDTRYYERLETDPLDGDVLDLNANESRVYESIKKMIEAKIRKNPSAFGLREKKINEIGDTSKGQYAMAKLAKRQHYRDKNPKKAWETSWRASDYHTNDRKGDSLNRAYHNGAIDGEKEFMKRK